MISVEDEHEITDEEFVRKYEKYETESTEDFIRRYSPTKAELKKTIDFLIRHREMLKDLELQRLESESQRLVEKLKDVDRQKLLEEIICFKEILALQRQLIEENDKPRD